MICKKKSLDQKSGLKYLIYFPDNYYSTYEEYPLVLFLHGAGERGNDLNLVKKHGIPKRIHDGAKFPFITVAPQCPDGIWWSNMKTLGFLEKIILELISDLRIAKNKIYGTGMSMGGYGILDLASTYPNLFTALIPICGGTILNKLHKLSKIPVWIFHGEDDDVIPVESSTLIYKYLKKNNKDTLITIYNNVAHDSWTETYDNEKIYDWMLKFKKL